MSNTFGISCQAEEELRARDKKCVYCGKAMTAHPETRGGRQTRVNQATIEHLNLDGPFDTSEGLKVEDVVICCCACNSSRGTKRLLDWFKSDYCVSRHINVRTLIEFGREPLLLFSKIN